MTLQPLTVSSFGFGFATGTAAEILRRVEAMPPAGPRSIVTANVDHVVTLSENASFREAYAAAAARTVDGTPLLWLLRLRGSAGGVRRVTGHDLLGAVESEARTRLDRRVFLLAASDATGRAVTRRLVAAGMPPDAIRFAVPPFGFERDGVYGDALAREIRDHRTTLLVMGVGAPKSEIWVHRQGRALGSPVVLNIGEALNVAAGLVPRAPRVLQAVGLEWLFRLALSPRRLFRRYLVRSPRFLRLALRGADLSPAGAASVLKPREAAAAP